MEPHTYSSPMSHQSSPLQGGMSSSTPAAPPGGLEAKHYTSPPAPPGGIEAKHYILAALAVTLIAAAVVTVVFVVLSPPRISFCVTESRHQDLAGGAVQLFLTINASNPSRRASVRYMSMYVDVSNNTGPLWTQWVRVNVTSPAAMPLDQPTRNWTKIEATVPLVGAFWVEDFTGNKTSGGFRVMITTVAWFKVGVSRTRLYDIKVTCGPLDFFGNQSSNNNKTCTDA